MYLIEYYDKRSYKELPHYTIKASKKEVQEEVNDLNSNVSKEVLKTLPVKYKYRLKKVKRNKD